MIGFACFARSMLHDAFGNATEDYTRTSTADACYSARVQGNGSVARRRVQDEVRRLHATPPPSVLDALCVAVFDFWAAVWERFVSMNAVAPPAVSEAEAPRCGVGGPSVDVRPMCAQLAGWAVGTLLANRAKSRFAPLLRHVKVTLPDDPGAERDVGPAVRFVLARQHYGGLTAVNSMVISAFFAAQTLLAANLTPALLVQHGPKAYDLAVEMVKTDVGVRAAFQVSLPSRRPAHTSGCCHLNTRELCGDFAVPRRAASSAFATSTCHSWGR